MDVKILCVVFFFLFAVAIAFWLVLSPAFHNFMWLESNMSYQAAILVLFVTPLSLIAFLGLVLYLTQEVTESESWF